MATKKKPGPKPENPKDTMLRVRVDKNTLNELDASAKCLSTTRSQVVRQGIHTIFKGLDKK